MVNVGKIYRTSPWGDAFFGMVFLYFSGRLALMQSRLHDMSALVKARVFFGGEIWGRYKSPRNHHEWCSEKKYEYLINSSIVTYFGVGW